MATYPGPEISGAAAVVPRPVETLASVYDYRDEEAVLAYLHTYTDLVDMLMGLPERVRHDLPVIGRPVLEVFHDPESDGPDGPLFALFPTQLPPADALERLMRMRADWWLDLYRRLGGRLNLDVEFR